MENKIVYSQNNSKDIKYQEKNLINLNQNENNIPEKAIEDKEENDNLGYLPGNEYSNFNNYNQNQRLDSTDSQIQSQFKYSIDIPTVSRQRLHEFLTDDVLKALDVSPSIPKLSGEIQENKNENLNQDNDPNKLIGFSLYSPNQQYSEGNFIKQNNNNMNYFSNSNNFANWGKSDNKNNIINNNFQNVYNNNINFNNYNYNINFPEMPNNNTNEYNIMNSLNTTAPIFMPKQMRNNYYNQKNNIIMNEKNMKYNNNNEKINSKNKFDNSKKTMQNSKKESKMKKPFEVRIGDWTCSKCNNLNFSFRNKCNRCGIPKEISEKLSHDLMAQEMMKQNMNFNLPNNGQF